MFKDSMTYVFRHLKRRRLRSWLTLLGIFIGMASVVALVSISEGLQSSITEEFGKIGADRIIVNPAGTNFGPFSAGLSSAKLTEHDVNVIKRVKGVEFAAGAISQTIPVYFKDEVSTGFIMGLPTDSKSTYYVERVGFWDLAEGRNPKPGAKYEACVGSSVAENSFSRNLTLRDSVTIKGIKFNIVGIGKSTGMMSDHAIRIPKETANQIFNISGDVSMIVVKVGAGRSPLDVAKDIEHSLRNSRNVKEGEEDFSVETSQEVIKSFLRVLGIVQMLIVGVAAISLVVGGIGIMNTMYTAVVERTKEIGIMKALGAKNRRILTIFLIESGFLGLAGGAIGVFLGLLIAKLAELIAASALGSDLLKADISAGLILGVLGFAFLLGAIAGYFPAKKAASMQPVEALRH